MKTQLYCAKILAISIACLAVCCGWINPLGKQVYAQYYCSLNCAVTAPSTGTAGNSVSFSTRLTTYYCEGAPTFTWEFGDGASTAAASPEHIYAAGGTYTWKVTVTADDASDSSSGTITIAPNAPSKLTGVSAASYDGTLFSSEEIVAAFGSGLASATEIASSIPLPTTLAGTTIKVKDSAGTERLASLFFVSPGQINYLLPPGMSSGTASVTVISGTSTVASGAVEVAKVAPGLFSANSSGQGVPSGYALRIKADNSQSNEALSQYDAAQARFLAVPIDFGPATDQVYLILYGTGIRSRSSLSAVTFTLGGENVPVLFAGPQGDFVGLDQINLQLPRTLSGRGDVEGVLTVDGVIANKIRLTFK